MGDPRVKPNIQCVRHLFIVIRIVLQQISGIQIEPRINAILLNQFGNRCHKRQSIGMYFPRHLVDE